MTQAPQIEPTQTDRAPVSKLAVTLLVVSALLGILAIAAVYAFLNEYGTTTGSWVDGAMGGLGFAAVPSLLILVLAAVAFAVGRRTTWVKVFAVVVVVLSVGGAMVAGGQAALAKYDRLAKVPFCGTAAEGSMAGARAAEAEFARLRHPEPFGAGFYGIDGCGANLLNVTLAEAEAHYRAELPAAGWTITRDNSTELAASRGDLIFVLTERCDLVDVEIRRAGTASLSQC